MRPVAPRTQQIEIICRGIGCVPFSDSRYGRIPKQDVREQGRARPHVRQHEEVLLLLCAHVVHPSKQMLRSKPQSRPSPKLNRTVANEGARLANPHTRALGPKLGWKPDV